VTREHRIELEYEMPKQKTHKGLAKRVKLSSKGKVKRKHGFKGHLMSGKGGKRRRHLKRPAGATKAITKKINLLIGG
jgi:large subunit ribosomal protein L35